jgi:cell division protein FtsZ
MAQPAGSVARAPAPQAAEKPRFGINSLINRMTGHAEAAALAPTQRQMPAAPQHQPYDDEQDPDQDRIEIPAFLRRQAN